jgi:hypothetical protein
MHHSEIINNTISTILHIAEKIIIALPADLSDLLQECILRVQWSITECTVLIHCYYIDPRLLYCSTLTRMQTMTTSLLNVV